MLHEKHDDNIRQSFLILFLLFLRSFRRTMEKSRCLFFFSTILRFPKAKLLTSFSVTGVPFTQGCIGISRPTIRPFPEMNQKATLRVLISGKIRRNANQCP